MNAPLRQTHADFLRGMEDMLASFLRHSNNCRPDDDTEYARQDRESSRADERHQFEKEQDE